MLTDIFLFEYLVSMKKYIMTLFISIQSYFPCYEKKHQKYSNAKKKKLDTLIFCALTG